MFIKFILNKPYKHIIRGEIQMFKFDGKYGNVHIDGMSADIDKINMTELGKYLERLERKRVQIIEQQNAYLSQIIE